MQLREEREREQLGGLRGQPRGGRRRRASGGRAGGAKHAFLDL